MALDLARTDEREIGIPPKGYGTKGCHPRIHAAEELHRDLLDHEQGR